MSGMRAFVDGGRPECPRELDADVGHHLLVGGDEDGRIQLLRRLDDGQEIPDIRIVEGGNGESSRVRGGQDRPHLQLAFPRHHAHPPLLSMKLRASSKVGMPAVAPTLR